MKKYIVIHNKNSRGKKLLKSEIEKLFISHNLSAIVYQTSESSKVGEIVLTHKEDNVIYCAIGGDGTLSNLIDHLLKNNIHEPEVACLPSGSGSDFMRTFAFPKNINDGIERLKKDENYKIDVAFISSMNKNRYFVNVLNYGFLADTVHTSENLPRIFKRFRYPISFWLKLLPAKSKLFEIENDKFNFKNVAFNVSICNGQFFGGGWNISPKSSLQDGLLNIQIFKVSKLKAMKLFFLAKKGLHLTEPDVILKKSNNLSLLTPNTIEVDGDYFDQGPADIIVKKQAILLKI